jgi:hypothetical protein
MHVMAARTIQQLAGQSPLSTFRRARMFQSPDRGGTPPTMFV